MGSFAFKKSIWDGGPSEFAPPHQGPPGSPHIRCFDACRTTTGQVGVPGKRSNLIKEVRNQLLETARPMLESLVHEVAGVKVLSMHHDISTVTGEEVVIFSLADAPRFQ